MGYLMSLLVTVVDDGARGGGVVVVVALLRTAGHGHSIVYRGTSDKLTTFMCRLS